MSSQSTPSPAESAHEAAALASAQENATGQAIPLPQVADQAEELDRLLEQIIRQMARIQQLLPAKESIKARAEEIRERRLYVEGLFSETPSVLELRDEELYWLSLNQEYAGHRKFLTAQATYLEDQIHFLDAQQLDWQATRAHTNATPGIGALVVRVQQELDAIQAMRLKVQWLLNQVLTFQSQFSQHDRQVSEVLAMFAAERQRMRDHLWERDGHPLWNARELRELGQPMIMELGQSVDRELQSTGDFLRAHNLLVLSLPLIYALALMAAFKMQRYVSALTDAEVPLHARMILSRPYSVALLVALLGTIGSIKSGTTGIIFFVVTLWLLQAIRLLPSLLEPEVCPLLYAMIPFILLEGARALIPFSPVLRRDLFLLNLLTALMIFAWLAHPWRLLRLHKAGPISSLLVAGVRAGVVLLALSLAANFFGFLSLSQVLGLTGLFGVLSAVILYGAARVMAVILNTLLRAGWARALPGMRVAFAEKWGARILVSLAAFLWLRGMLHLLTVYDGVMGAISSALHYPFGYGNVHFTIAGALSVLLILLVGYAAAKAFTFLLKRVLLPRLPLNRGVPYAISTVTYYLLLLLVAVVALADAGVELNKFTVLTGALGVGLGFGLQNIVNNFVSGLILLFERPIHIGDVVDVGGLVGTVKRIGARSSTVLTFQGAEVIVPNSNLLSNQVVNWTLSSPWRRVDIPVGVAFGTDPERVLKLLVEVGKTHSGVLLEREPVAYFLGFGESALNFELRFWSPRQDTWLQLQSEVTVAISKALRDAGIEIPFPQRDLHVRSIDVPLGESVAASSLPATPPLYAPRSEASPTAVSRSSINRAAKHK